MKLYALSIALLLLFISCHSPSADNKPGTAEANDNAQGPILQDSLSTVQIKKLTWIQGVFAEVYPVSLEETIQNFRRDEHPDQEIEVWLHMATAYQEFIKNTRGIDYQKKKDAFSLLLLRSMMPEAEAINEMPANSLTEPEVTQILHDFSEKRVMQ